MPTGLKVVDLQKKIDLILCLYDGSSKNFVKHMQEMQKKRGGGETVSQRTVTNWCNSGKMSDEFIDIVSDILNIDRINFVNLSYISIFRSLACKCFSPFDMFRSFSDKKSKTVNIENICGKYSIFYSNFDCCGSISVGEVEIYHKDGLFKINGCFMPGTIKRNYHGFVSLCEGKLYMIFECMDIPGGISMVIANMPIDHEAIHPFHGILISTSSLQVPQNPSSTLIYFVPINYNLRTDVESVDDDICKIGNYNLDSDKIKNSIGCVYDLLQSNKGVIQAKAVELEKMRPNLL